MRLSALSGVYLISLSLLILLSEAVRGQSDFENQASMHSSIDAMYGSQYLRKDTLDNYLSDKKGPTFTNYSKIVGINISNTFTTGRFGEQDGYVSIQYQLPNRVSASDSIDYSLTGYQLGFCLGGKDLLYANEDFDLIYAFGAQLGYYYIKRSYLIIDIPDQRSRNGVIAPQLVLEARYFTGLLKLGFKMRAQYDISNTTWNHLDPSGTDFGGFAATGVAFQALIGFKLD